MPMDWRTDYITTKGRGEGCSSVMGGGTEVLILLFQIRHTSEADMLSSRSALRRSALHHSTSRGACLQKNAPPRESQ